MRPHPLSLGKLTPLLNQRGNARRFGAARQDAFKDFNLLPDLAQQPFRTVIGAARHGAVATKGVAGQNKAFIGFIGIHGGEHSRLDEFRQSFAHACPDPHIARCLGNSAQPWADHLIDRGSLM